MSLMTEQVASYIFERDCPYGIYNVFACYDNMDDYDNRKVSFYDVYEQNGICVNEGDPFYDFPSWQEIYDYYWLPSVREAEKTHSRDLKEATK